jgi:S-DNA-T family DNA segregation ATPase FtsK/SpoIIIE
MLQTHLRVGYARARRIIVQLANLGIVGPHEGSKSRKVLISPEELEGWKKEQSEKL